MSQLRKYSNTQLNAPEQPIYYMHLDKRNMYRNVLEENMKRTTIVIDEKLIKDGLKATGLKTCRALVDYALRDPDIPDH